jgi:hypothetical protein
LSIPLLGDQTPSSEDEKMSQRACRSTDQLRSEFLDKALSSFDRMFAAERQDELIGLLERENLSIELSDELGRLLLQAHLENESASAPTKEVRCPKCRKAARWIEDKAPEERRFLCERGEISISRTRYKCDPCRITFFPHGPSVRTGD